MSRADRILHLLNENKNRSVDSIRDAFDAELAKHDFNITVEDVKIDGNDTFIAFTDEEGDEVSVLFALEDKTPFAHLMDDSESKKAFSIDLTEFNPPIIIDGDDAYIDMSNLVWVTKGLFETLFNVNELDEPELDAFGHEL